MMMNKERGAEGAPTTIYDAAAAYADDAHVLSSSVNEQRSSASVIHATRRPSSVLSSL